MPIRRCKMKITMKITMKVFNIYMFFVILSFSLYFSIEGQVYEILEVVGDDYEYEDVQKLLEKFDYDNEKIVDHLLKYKGLYIYF